MIRLIIAEDSKVVRKGLVMLFGQETDIRIVADTEDGKDALDILRSGQECDIVLADLNMPEVDGLELTKSVSQEFPSVKMVLLTMHAKEAYLERAKNLGAKGFLLKQMESEELVDAIRRIAAGEEIF